MSLGLVILTEEGVVMAAESLGTLLVQEQAKLQSPCRKCNEQVEPNMVCPKCGKALGSAPILSRQFPATHTYYCQKLFRINEHTGLIVVGNPTIGEMKAQHRIVAFISWLKENNRYADYAEQIVQHWQTFCGEAKVMETQKGATELVIAGIRAEGSLMPFSQTLVMTKAKIEAGAVSSVGIVAVGVHEMLDKMFGGGGIREYPVKEFPLQDAVEFVEFLMQTQIGVDKYTARIPRVGGDIDVAVIHANFGFTWVKQKTLLRMMEEHANKMLQPTS